MMRVHADVAPHMPGVSRWHNENRYLLISHEYAGTTCLQQEHSATFTEQLGEEEEQ